MVQRTKLAVVFLLAVIAGIFSAQESGFIMPKIISDPVLEIPVNWKQTYMPAEVMILVDIKADSTVSLLRILDGKTELQPLIEEQLPYLKFTPAIRNGIAIDANLSLKLKIIESEIATYTEQKTTADSLRLLRKAELLSWINRQRQADDLQKMFSSNADAGIRFAPQLTDAFYRTNFRLMGLNSKPYLIFNNGFIQPAGLFYDAVMLQMLANFKRLRANESNILFANEKFTLPAMCTDVYAGLGDYEHNFARVLTFKNHMLGVKDFYSEMGFLVQNGFWQEVVADQTSTRLFLSLPVKKAVISANWEKYDQSLPSSSLLSGMQNDVLYTIGNIHRDIHFKAELPWFTLGWRDFSESYKGRQYLLKQNYSAKQLLLKSHLSTNPLDLDFIYQYSYEQKLPEVQTLYQNSSNPEHQAIVRLNKEHAGFDYSAQVYASEDGLEQGIADIGITGRLGRIGLYHFNNLTKSKYQTNVHLYNDSLYSNFISNKQKTASAIKYRLPERTTGFNAYLTSGMKEFEVRSYDVSSNSEQVKTYSALYSESMLQYSQSIGKYTGFAEQVCNWTQYNKGLAELPELMGQARFRIVKDMDYGNTLFGGISLTGHTDFINGDNNSIPIYGSMIADAWLGVSITDLFEFQLMMRNIGSNSIFGLYPHPRAIIANIHWFYLN